ncbi:MAG: sterol desaturase family protein [Bacteroidia bacterium]|nr:sterol desaturase family protein [Bacteroidia bacterium]
MLEKALEVGAKIYAANLIRYVVLAGLAYLIFYVIWKARFAHKRIQKRDWEKKKLWMEVGYSVATMFIFALNGILVFWGKQYGIFHTYQDFNEHSWAYFFFTIVAAIFIHDTYFYWAHRFMHLKWVFPHVHKVHHLSNNPSPWAAFSFHPTEAFLEAAIIPILLFIMPMHMLAILVFLMYMTMMNVLGHLGYELYPKGFLRHPLGRLNNTSTHHNMHHRLVNCNYGLYFNFWDLLMRTNHEKYQSEFERLAGQEPQKEEEILEKAII